MEDVYTFLFDDYDWIPQVLAALLPILLILRLALIETHKCYLLLYRINRGNPRGRWFRICATLIAIALQDGTLFKSERRTLLRRVRMRAEHELFVPRPEFHWPPRSSARSVTDDCDVATPEPGWHARRTARSAYRKAIADWKHEMAQIFEDSRQFITLDSPAEANEKLDDVKHYFHVVRSLHITGEEAGIFLSPLRINSGFIAPLHLLTGLLATFDDTWEPILRAFNRDSNDSAGLRMGELSREVRQIQMFIYNCWLLWGPSVPLCSCSMWQGDYQLVQYGFGDENNSIEIVGEGADIRTFLDELMREQNAAATARLNDGENPVPPQSFTGMAIPARVVGQLRLSSSLTGGTAAALDELPQAARDSWGRDVNERPVVFISEIFHTSAIEQTARRDRLAHGKISLDLRALPSRYYSAYLWVGFVLLGEDNGELKPLSWLGAEQDRRPWQDFIPFFEHGNLADAESCLFAKQQLASKAVAALASLVRRWQPGEIPVRFAFACAIDESGCGWELAYPAWNGGITMRQLVRSALREGAEKWQDDAYRRLLNEAIIRLDFFSGDTGGHPYSACTLPSHIGKHYDTMDASD